MKRYRVAMGERTYFIHDLLVEAPNQKEAVKQARAFLGDPEGKPWHNVKYRLNPDFASSGSGKVVLLEVGEVMT